jgi:ABC-type multidrug transport system fused ATPase/permease subunit
VHGRERKTTSAHSFYAHGAKEVLRRPREAALFLLSGAAYALGHAAIAVAIAGCVEGLGGNAGTALFTAKPLTFALAGLAAAILKSLGNVLGTAVQARMGGEVGAALRERVLATLLTEASLARARHSDQGGATKETGWATRVTALTGHVAACEDGLAAGLLATLRAVLQLVPLVALLVALAPRLSVLAVLVLLPLGVVLGRARRGLRRGLRREAEKRESLLAAADEAVRHAELFRAFGAASRVRARVRALGASLARQAVRVAALGAAISGANEIAGAFVVVLVVLAVRSGVLGDDASSTLLPFTLTFFMAYRPVRDLGDARVASAKASVAFAALRPLLESTEAPSEPAAGVAFPSGRLEVHELVLAQGTLGPLDFVIGPGEIVGLVAPTGAGKTTLFRTLLGFEAPRAGDVRWEGASILRAGIGPAERPFAWCPQEAPLVADTLAENVVLGAATDDPAPTASAALDAVGARSLARDVSARVDGRNGEGARVLSGGERQWVALARALATRAPVLLLDEPTAGLDAAAQRDVLAAIALLRGKRSILLVTHREEPLAVCDRVLRLDAPARVAA